MSETSTRPVQQWAGHFDLPMKTIKAPHEWADPAHVNDVLPSAVAYIDNGVKFQGFSVAFRFEHKGDIYYQGLHLDCRHGAAARVLFEAARRLYGRLRREKQLAKHLTFQRLLRGY